jgi:hypothetical protein
MHDNANVIALAGHAEVIGDKGKYGRSLGYEQAERWRNSFALSLTSMLASADDAIQSRPVSPRLARSEVIMVTRVDTMARKGIRLQRCCR